MTLCLFLTNIQRYVSCISVCDLALVYCECVIWGVCVMSHDWVQTSLIVREVCVHACFFEVYLCIVGEQAYVGSTV